MPRAAQHLLINSVVLASVELYVQSKEIERNPTQKLDWGRLLVSVGAGACAGALPDILEPSLGNPNHRGFCHSLCAALLVWWMASGRHTHTLSPELRRVMFALGAGYSCHLGADLFLTKAKGMGLINASL